MKTFIVNIILVNKTLQGLRNCPMWQRKALFIKERLYCRKCPYGEVFVQIVCIVQVVCIVSIFFISVLCAFSVLSTLHALCALCALCALSV